MKTKSDEDDRDSVEIKQLKFKISTFFFIRFFGKDNRQYNLLVMIILSGVVISEWDSVSPAKVINQPHTFDFKFGQIEHVI